MRASSTREELRPVTSTADLTPLPAASATAWAMPVASSGMTAGRKLVVPAIEHHHAVRAEHLAHRRRIGEIGKHQRRIDVIGHALAHEFLYPAHRPDPDQDHLLADGLNGVEQQIEQFEIGQVMDMVDHHGDEIDRLGGEALRQKIWPEPQFGSPP